jgi:hypothetical protein
MTAAAAPATAPLTICQIEWRRKGHVSVTGGQTSKQRPSPTMGMTEMLQFSFVNRPMKDGTRIMASQEAYQRHLARAWHVPTATVA